MNQRSWQTGLSRLRRGVAYLAAASVLCVVLSAVTRTIVGVVHRAESAASVAFEIVDQIGRGPVPSAVSTRPASTPAPTAAPAPVASLSKPSAPPPSPLASVDPPPAVASRPIPVQPPPSPRPLHVRQDCWAAISPEKFVVASRLADQQDYMAMAQMEVQNDIVELPQGAPLIAGNEREREGIVAVRRPGSAENLWLAREAVAR